MGWFKKEEKKKEWVLVKTTSTPIIRIINPSDRGKMWFYLYETIDGERKEEHKITELSNISESPDNLDFYRETIYPWLKGVNFKDIPSYWDTIKERHKDDIKRIYKRFWK